MSITRSPLTVLHLSTEKLWHGGEQQALHLATGLREKGHRCVVAARQDGAFAERMRTENFELQTFHRRGRGPDALWALRRLVRSIRPDVIHSHDGHALTASGLATLRLRQPLRVASRRVDFPIRSSAKFRHLADVVIAISRAVMDVCQEGGIPESMLRIVPSGVDPARVAAGDRGRGRVALGVQEDEPLLTVVATLTPHKGHTSLLEALPEVITDFPKTSGGSGGRWRVDRIAASSDTSTWPRSAGDVFGLQAGRARSDSCHRSICDAIAYRGPVYVTSGCDVCPDSDRNDRGRGNCRGDRIGRSVGALRSSCCPTG